MVTQNKDLLHGIAKGTVCKFRKLVLKPCVETGKIEMYTYWVNTIAMDDVEYIEVEWQDCDHFIGKFCMKTETALFKVKFPISKFG
jgi:hypothetical protein